MLSRYQQASVTHRTCRGLLKFPRRCSVENDDELEDEQRPIITSRPTGRTSPKPATPAVITSPTNTLHSHQRRPDSSTPSRAALPVFPLPKEKHLNLTRPTLLERDRDRGRRPGQCPRPVWLRNMILTQTRLQPRCRLPAA